MGAGTMNITEVHVRMNARGKLRAFASITIDGWFVVRGLKVIEKVTGDLFVAMPTRDDNGRDICHPVHQQGRAYLTERVLAAYETTARGARDRDRQPTEGAQPQADA